MLLRRACRAAFADFFGLKSALGRIAHSSLLNPDLTFMKNETKAGTLTAIGSHLVMALLLENLSLVIGQVEAHDGFDVFIPPTGFLSKSLTLDWA